MKKVNIALRQIFDYFERDPQEYLTHVLKQLALEIGNEYDNEAYIGDSKRNGRYCQVVLVFRNGDYIIKLENQNSQDDQIINHYEI